MQRVALINGKNVNQDYDLAKIFQSIATPGVVKGLEVQNGKVTKGYAFVEIERNGIEFVVLFENTDELQLDTSGDKKVYIEIKSSNIQDGTLNSTDGSAIGEVKVGNNYPGKNFLRLASITDGNISDERIFVTTREIFNITKQGNTFNSAEKLLKLDGNGKVPVSNLPEVSVNIHGLQEDNGIDSNDELVYYDNSSGQIKKRKAKASENYCGLVERANGDEAKTLSDWERYLSPGALKHIARFVFLGQEFRPTDTYRHTVSSPGEGIQDRYNNPVNYFNIKMPLPGTIRASVEYRYTESDRGYAIFNLDNSTTGASVKLAEMRGDNSDNRKTSQKKDIQVKKGDIIAIRVSADVNVRSAEVRNLKFYFDFDLTDNIF